MAASDEFYVSDGRKGKFGFEFFEFEFQPNGKMRYVNQSRYKRDVKIEKSVWVSETVLKEVKRMIEESKVIEMDDAKWPEPTKDSKQELEVILGDTHISFSTLPVVSLMETRKAEDPVTLLAFHNLVQDLKCLILPLISVHFKINPLGNQNSTFE